MARSLSELLGGDRSRTDSGIGSGVAIDQIESIRTILRAMSELIMRLFGGNVLSAFVGRLLSVGGEDRASSVRPARQATGTDIAN